MFLPAASIAAGMPICRRRARQAFLVSLISTYPPVGALSRTSPRPRPQSRAFTMINVRGPEHLHPSLRYKDHALLVPQSRQRINSGRSPCRRIASENRGAQEDDTGQRQSSRIIGLRLEQKRFDKPGCA